MDQAALRAARSLGIASGGWAPRGWMTLDGPAPWLAHYGLVEHARPGYPPRTEANVRDSDATLRLAADFLSPGEKLTIAMVHRCKKPHAEVFLTADRVNGGYRATHAVIDDAPIVDLLALYALARMECSPAPDVRILKTVIMWMRRYRVINVAGNSERTAPGIGLAAEALLRSLFMESK